RQSRTTLFPYTTLFRSNGSQNNRTNHLPQIGPNTTTLSEENHTVPMRTNEQRGTVNEQISKENHTVNDVSRKKSGKNRGRNSTSDRKSTRLNSSHVSIS